MPRYWKKEIPETPFYLPVGKPITFDFVVDDCGYLATDDGYVNAELVKARAAGRAGVSEITFAEFTEALKKKPESSSQQRPWQRPSLGSSPRRNREAVERAVAADSVVGVMADGRAVSSFASPQQSEGLKVDRQFVRPRVGRAPAND